MATPAQQQGNNMAQIQSDLNGFLLVSQTYRLGSLTQADISKISDPTTRNLVTYYNTLVSTERQKNRNFDSDDLAKQMAARILTAYRQNPSAPVFTNPANLPNLLNVLNSRYNNVPDSSKMAQGVFERALTNPATIPALVAFVRDGRNSSEQVDKLLAMSLQLKDPSKAKPVFDAVQQSGRLKDQTRVFFYSAPWNLNLLEKELTTATASTDPEILNGRKTREYEIPKKYEDLFTSLEEQLKNAQTKQKATEMLVALVRNPASIYSLEGTVYAPAASLLLRYAPDEFQKILNSGLPSAYKDNLVKAIAEEGLASTSLPESSLTAFRAVLSLYYRTNSWITKNTETRKEEVKVDDLIENYPEIALALVKDSHYSRLREAIKKYMTNKIADYIASKKLEEITFIIQDNDDTATEKLAKIHAVEKMSASEYLRYASKEGKDLDLPYSDEKFAQVKRTLGIVSYVIPKRTDEESEG